MGASSTVGRVPSCYVADVDSIFGFLYALQSTTTLPGVIAEYRGRSDSHYQMWHFPTPTPQK